MKNVSALFFTLSFILFAINANAQTSGENYSEAQKAFYKSCSSRHLTDMIYDCACLTDMYHETVEEIKKKGKERMIESYKTKGKRMLKFACDKNKKVSIRGGRVAFYPENPRDKEQVEKSHGKPLDPCSLLKDLEAGNLPDFPDPGTEPDITHVSTELYKNVSCRDEQSIYEEYYNQGKSQYNSPLLKLKTEKTEEEFCDCYAKEITSRLMQGEEHSSRFSSNANSKAISKCK